MGAVPSGGLAAYWTLEPGWDTVLEMRNNVASRDLTVQPVLRASTGQETVLATITIPPHHVTSLDLRRISQISGANPGQTGSFGSVAFRFDGATSANIFAATIVRREGEPIDFHFDARDIRDTSYYSPGIEGIWWLASATSTDYLILTNPLKTQVIGTLALTSDLASYRPIGLSLEPGETRRIDLRAALGMSANGAMGGLRLSLSGRDSILATQIVYDEVTGLAAVMKLFDRLSSDRPKNRTLRAPMMALSQPDPGLGFPDGTQLTPRIFLRNAASTPTQIAAAIDWRNQSSGTFSLPPLTLAPGELKVIRLADYQQAHQMPLDANWATVRLAYSGHRADLVAVALSYDRTSRYGLQTPFSEAVSRHWAGGMWHADATHNTFITTGNGGTEATTAEATLFYNGGRGQYRTTAMLAPGQQLWLDVARLVREQIPDADGNTLPAGTMTGSYELRDLDHPAVGQLYEGKLVIDKTYGHASYGCLGCCGYTMPYIDPNPFDGPPDINNEDYIYSTDSCSEQLTDVTDLGYNWTSSNTAVATLPNRTLHTVALGTAKGSAELEMQYYKPPECPEEYFDPEQPVNVAPQITSIDPNPITVGTAPPNGELTINGSGFGTSPTFSLPAGVSYTGQGSTDTQIVLQGVSVAMTATVGNNNVTVTAAGQTSAPANLVLDGPYHMVVEGDAVGPCSGCHTTIARRITYQIQNFSGSVAQNVWMGETVTDSGWSCTQGQPTISSAPCSANYIAANGFTDQWTLGSDGYTPTGCGFGSSTDIWQWCAHNPAQTLGNLSPAYLRTSAIEEDGVVNPPNSIPIGTVLPF